ncbi:MAG: helical backbone metal receptor [bacterium]
MSSLIFLSGCKEPVAKTAEQTASKKTPKRIVSLAPTVTETLFALGLDKEIVGVTNYCNYPPKAKTKTRTGGLMDQNFEAVLGLQPDLVIALPCHAATVSKLNDLGVRTLSVNNETISNLLSSIKAIGAATGKKTAAAKLVSDLKAKIESARSVRPDSKRPRVMIVVGRNPGTLQNIYVAGNSNFFNEALVITGGKNIFGDVRLKYPQPSLEEIISRNPQIIIESLVGFDYKPEDVKRFVNEWNALGDVDAVKNHRVYVWTEDYVSIPGPRLPQLLEKLEKALNEPAPAKSNPANRRNR